MKKLISLILVLTMVLSMATVASADDPDPQTMTNGEVNTSGTITISGIHPNSQGNVDTVYDIYKLLHLESYNGEKEAYSYVVATGWEEFFETGAGKNYVTKNDKGYITWVEAKDDATVAAFAKAALAYAKEENIAPVQTTADAELVDSTTLKFTGLSLGYYLVDSNVGSLCGLTTTNPDGLISAKNGAPTVDKQVQEDSAVDSGTNSWFDTNSADIGQYVKFDVTINVHSGAQNYVFHDKMSTGLTFKHEKIGEDQHGIIEVVKYEPDTSTKTTLVMGADKDYELVTDPEKISDGCTFEIIFSQAVCDGLQTNDKLYITYDAKLNDKAVIGGEGNPNEAWLKYGEGHETTHDQTTTYTYGFDIVKTDSSNKLIDGATFKVYNQEIGGDPIYIVQRENGVYRKATTLLDTENEKEVDSIITVENGIARVEGFDNGTYYLEEVTAPNGYNKLTSRVKFTISDANLDSTIDINNNYTSGTGVQVKNSTGSALPETGATGTMIFITFGMIVMLATGLLLVTKKRMSMIQE